MFEKLKEKKQAFMAWNNGKCSDSELKIALDAIRETNETLLAIGVSPISTHGFVMLEHSLQTAHDARRRS